MHTVHDERLWHSKIDTKPSFSLETWQHAGPANSEVHGAPLVWEVDGTSRDFTEINSNPEQSSLDRNFDDDSDAVAMEDFDFPEDRLQVESLEDELKGLTEHEKQLAVQYRMAESDTESRHIDSVAVFEETKHRAMSDDESAYPSFEKLHRLRHLRTQLYELGKGFGSIKLKPFPRITLTERPHGIDASRFWAVIIGIDGYKRYPLCGCVADALLMKTYLEKDLKVPINRIQLLLGKKDTPSNDPSIPSRDNITNTLCSLISNPNIKKGDNIVIFFAGHGSSYTCSECPRDVEERKSSIPDVRVSTLSYSAKNKGYERIDAFCPTEALCPIDRDIIDANGHKIPDISDREINTILYEISRAKGNQITVILDCCHSASITRDPKSRVRSALPLTDGRDVMFLIGMQNLMRISNRTSIMEQRWRPDMSSHVVVAACNDYEFAGEHEMEGEFHGFFTHSLVKALRSGFWTKEMTYVDLVQGLQSRRRQTPVVAGDYMRSRLWYQTM